MNELLDQRPPHPQPGPARNGPCFRRTPPLIVRCDAGLRPMLPALRTYLGAHFVIDEAVSPAMDPPDDHDEPIGTNTPVVRVLVDPQAPQVASLAATRDAALLVIIHDRAAPARQVIAMLEAGADQVVIAVTPVEVAARIRSLARRRLRQQRRLAAQLAFTERMPVRVS